MILVVVVGTFGWIFPRSVVIEGPLTPNGIKFVDNSIEISYVLSLGQKDSYIGKCELFSLQDYGNRILISESDGNNTLPVYVFVGKDNLPWVLTKITINCNGEKGVIFIR